MIDIRVYLSFNVSFAEFALNASLSIFKRIFVLIMLYTFLKRYYGNRASFLGSILYIFSPIGFSIASITEDSTGNNLILLSMLFILYIFFEEDKKEKYTLSFVLLPLSLFINFYNIVLVASIIVYLIFKYINKLGSRKRLLSYIPRLLITSVITMPFLLYILSSLLGIFSSDNSTRLNYVKLSILNPEKLNLYFRYLTETFFLRNVQGIANETLILLSSIVFIMMLLASYIYFFRLTLFKKRNSILSIFIFYIPIFFVIDLVLNNMYAVDISRVPSIRVHYLLPIFIISFILISVFLTKNKAKKTYLITFILFALLNLIILSGSISYGN